MQKREYQMSRQQQDYYCMPAVVEAILRRHNLLQQDETQKTLAEKLNCTPEDGVFFGKDLQRFLNGRGLLFKDVLYNEVMFKDPEFLLDQAFEFDEDLILGCLNGGGKGHVRLVTGYEWPNLETLDPKDAEPYGVDLEKLYSKMWTDKFGVFCLVSKIESD
jgi:hypothetical protein